MKKSILLASATAAILLGATHEAAADDVAPGTGSSASGKLEEIIVFARKKSERLEDVPTAISVFSGEALEKYNVQSVDQLSRLVTGLTFDSDFGRLGDRPIIRGQSNILGDSGVSYFIDGVYYTGTLLDFNLDDVASIEVIKGPQSALHGRNTYSGAISVATRVPSFEWNGVGKVEYAEFDQKRVFGSVSGPLIKDNLAVALSGSYYDRGGVTGDLWRNKYDGKAQGEQQSKTINFGTYWTPNDRFDLRTRVYWTDQQDGQPPLFIQGYKENNVYFDNGNRRPTVIGDQFFPVAYGPGSVYLGAGRYYAGEIKAHQIDVDARRSLGVKPEISDDRLLTAAILNFKATDNLTATYIVGYNTSKSDANYDFDYQSTSYGPFLTSSVGLRPRTSTPDDPGDYEYAVSTGAPAANFSALEHGKSHDLSNELRLRYKKDDLDLLLGGYYYKSKVDSYFRQKPVAGWGDMLVESLGVLQGRLQTACNTFFQNRPGFPNCTSIVRRASSGNPTPVAFDSTTGLWTTFPDDNNHDETTNKAVFGSASYLFFDRLELSGEIRYAEETQERLKGQLNQIAYFTNLTENVPFSSSEDVPYQKATFKSTTPRFTARYDLTADNHLFAVAAKGTKPGGINGPRAAQVGYGSFEEESVWSYELGTKNVFLDGRFLVNASIYHNKIDGYQATDSIVYTDGGASTAVKNIGEVQTEGLELELAYAPELISGLNLHLNYTNTRTKILKGSDANQGVLNDVADDGQLNCSLGLAPAYAELVAQIRADNPSIPPSTVICHNDTGTVYFGAYGSIVGRKLPRVPEHNINAGVDYSHPLTGNWSLNTVANVSYESKKYVQVDNLAYYGEATIVNASIGLSNPRYAITLWGNNLTDDNSVVSASRFTDATNQSLRAFFAANRLPRQFGLTASAKF